MELNGTFDQQKLLFIVSGLTIRKQITKHDNTQMLTCNQYNGTTPNTSLHLW